MFCLAFMTSWKYLGSHKVHTLGSRIISAYIVLSNSGSFSRMLDLKFGDHEFFVVNKIFFTVLKLFKSFNSISVIDTTCLLHSFRRTAVDNLCVIRHEWPKFYKPNKQHFY